MHAPTEVLEEISRDYERTLDVPNHKPSPQWMLMPVGLMGAGKTTVLKPLAKHFGLIRISTDEIRERLKRRGYSYEGVRDVAHKLQKKYLERGYSIAIDANTGSRFGLEYNKKTKEAFPHVRQIFIHINPPEEFIVNKLKNYSHTWLFKDGDTAVNVFHTYSRKNYTPTNLPFVYTFDPSRENFQEQINECIGAIEKRLKSTK